MNEAKEKNKVKEKIAKLIDAKTLMTLTLTLVFCALSLMEVIGGDQFLTIYSTVTAFYYGTQAVKKKKEDEGNGKD